MKQFVIVAVLLMAFSPFAASQATHVAPSCPTYYYFNASSADCQAQALSPACPPSNPNPQILYLCTGVPANQSVCTSGYVFSDNHCLLSTTHTTIANSNLSVGNFSIPNISSGNVDSGISIALATLNSIFQMLKNYILKALGG
jgi:hypothetical protein